MSGPTGEAIKRTRKWTARGQQMDGRTSKREMGVGGTLEQEGGQVWMRGMERGYLLLLRAAGQAGVYVRCFED